MMNLFIIVVMLFLGYGLGRLSILPKDAPHLLNKFVIYIALPAMILIQVPKLTLNTDMMIPVAVSWIVMMLLALIVWGVCRYMEFDKSTTGALLLVAVLPNSSFLGIPIIDALYGGYALPYAVVYDQLGSFIALATYGTIILSIYSGKRASLSKSILKIITFPPFVTLIIALLISIVGLKYNDTIVDILTLLSNLIMPAALLAVGIQLQFRLPSHEVIPLGVALILKLMISPLIAILVCYIFDWDNLASEISIIESGMGPMISAAALASLSGLSPRLTSAIVGYGILLSLVTISFIFFVVL